MRQLRIRAVAGATAVTAAAFVLAVGSSGAATSRVLFVDRDASGCSDSGSGTLDQPFCTITAAARAVTAGDTVQVAGGSYPESVTLPTSGTSTAAITFTASPKATVTLTGPTNGPRLSSGFVLSGRSWVKVSGFSITKTSSYGISVSNSSHITLSDNHVSYAGEPVSGQTKSGISLSNVSDSEISRNTIDHNSNYGMYVLSGCTRNLVKSNTSFANAQGYQRAASGIRFSSSSGNTITGNSTYGNEDSGIELVTGSQNNLVVNNLVYNNGDHGIDDTGASPNNSIIGNTVYHNVTAGIDLEGEATGSSIYNNIAVDNGINSPRTWGNIRVYSTSTVGTTLDYNLVYHTVPGQSNYVWGSDYDDLSVTEMRKVSGQEMHSIQADPMWTSPSTADFTLRPGSPAIDSASSGVLGASSTDANDNARTDDPLTPNTGVGPRSFDDRGPLEYKPRDAAPHPSVSVTPSSATVNQAVTADASASYDEDGTSPIASYRFDFGDASGMVGPQSAPTATHAYTRSGTYTVTVYVSDTAGLVATNATTVKVGDAAPSAVLSLQPSTGPAPLAVSADASASTAADGTSIASYAFDWGDGTPTTGPRTGASATHVYATAGSYVVTVTVTDTAGQADAASSPVSVKANVVGNPGFESATSGWNTSGSTTGVTLVRVDGGHTGTGSAKLATAGTSGTCTLNDAPNWVKLTPAAGTRYTASVWVRGETAGATLKLRVTEYNSAAANLGSVTMLVPLTTAWQKASVNYTTAAAGSSLDFNAYMLGVPTNTTCFYADDAAIFMP